MECRCMGGRYIKHIIRVSVQGRCVKGIQIMVSRCLGCRCRRDKEFYVRLIRSRDKESKIYGRQLHIILYKCIAGSTSEIIYVKCRILCYMFSKGIYRKQVHGRKKHGVKIHGRQMNWKKVQGRERHKRKINV